MIDFLEALAQGTVQVPEPDTQTTLSFPEPKYDRAQEDDGTPD